MIHVYTAFMRENPSAATDYERLYSNYIRICFLSASLLPFLLTRGTFATTDAHNGIRPKRNNQKKDLQSDVFQEVLDFLKMRKKTMGLATFSQSKAPPPEEQIEVVVSNTRIAWYMQQNATNVSHPFIFFFTALDVQAEIGLIPAYFFGLGHFDDFNLLSDCIIGNPPCVARSLTEHQFPYEVFPYIILLRLYQVPHFQDSTPKSKVSDKKLPIRLPSSPNKSKQWNNIRLNAHSDITV